MAAITRFDLDVSKLTRQCGCCTTLVVQNEIQIHQQKTEKSLYVYAIIDLFHIVFAHACIGHVTRYFSIIGETLQRWGKRILSH